VVYLAFKKFGSLTPANATLTMLRFLLTTALIALGTLYLNAQKITGTVLDETGTPIIGANLVIKGTTRGTTTDFDGKFALSATSLDFPKLKN